MRPQLSRISKYVASKNQKSFMADLKCVYKAAPLSAAESALDELEANWSDKYPMVIKSCDQVADLVGLLQVSRL